MAKSRQVEYLPQGWEWRSKGQETWTTSNGKQSTERHAVNVNTGETESVRQVQNRQRAYRQEVLGQPKAPSIPRKGKTRTIYGAYIPGDNTRGLHESGSLYNQERHGEIKTVVFRDLESAWAYVLTQEDISRFLNVHIQVRYTRRLITTTKTGSDKENQKNGFATITPFRTGDFYMEGAQNMEVGRIGINQNPWHQAALNMQKYDMSGDKARVYLVLKEA